MSEFSCHSGIKRGWQFKSKRLSSNSKSTDLEQFREVAASQFSRVLPHPQPVRRRVLAPKVNLKTRSKGSLKGSFQKPCNLLPDNLEVTYVNLMPWKTSDSGQGGVTMLASPMERELSHFHENFDRLFQRLWNDSALFDGRWGMDFEETEKHYVARLDAPGFEIEDFDVQAARNQLSIKAERKESQNGSNRSSSRCCRLERVIPLPEGAATEEITARYHSGVLELQIPKGKEANNVRRIAIKS
jgi:HSP20 family protein